MTPNKEKELTKHLKTLDKDQLIKLLVQFKCEAELLQGVANDVLDAMNEKLVLEKGLELALKDLYFADKEYYIGKPPSQGEYVEAQTKYWIEQARESLKDDK